MSAWDLFLTITGAVVCARMFQHIQEYPVFTWYFACLLGGLWAPSIPDFILHQNPTSSAFSVYDAFMWWIVWHHRPRRKRRPSKILGKVKDLGHRLIVTPA